MKISILVLSAIIYLVAACKKDEPTPQTLTFRGTIQIVQGGK